MNFSEMPTWFWIAAGVIAYLYASRKGWLKNDSTRSESPPASTTNPAAQVVELRHVVGASEDAAGGNEITETRRVDFGFDVSVKPVPKTKGP